MVIKLSLENENLPINLERKKSKATILMSKIQTGLYKQSLVELSLIKISVNIH